MSRRFNSDSKPEYTTPDAPCSGEMLTLVWKLSGYSLKTKGKDANGRPMRWDITFTDCGNVIEYMIALRQAHSTDGNIWHLSPDGKRILREYSSELIAQFPLLKPTPKDDGVKTIAAPVLAAPALVKPVIGGGIVTRAKVLRRKHIKPTGSIPIGKPSLTH